MKPPETMNNNNNNNGNNNSNSRYVTIGIVFFVLHVLLYSFVSFLDLHNVAPQQMSTSSAMISFDPEAGAECLMEEPEKIKWKSLFVYSYDETSNENKDNLLYFIEVAIRKSDPMDYLIVASEDVTLEIPNFSNVEILKGTKTRSDWERWRHGINHRKNKLNDYEFFFFVSASTRGPFIPSYWYPADSTEQEKSEVYHWSVMFTLRITNEVKLVGATQKCLNEQDRKGPVVDSYFWVVDRSTLVTVLSKDGPFNEKRKLKGDAEEEYEMTQLMLKAGYNIDSMLLAYANKEIDWRESHNWNCNNNLPPTETNTYFGATTHPFEVVFFKKHWETGDVQREAFDRYSKWIMESTRVEKLLDAIEKGEIEQRDVQDELDSLQEAPRTFEPLLPHFRFIDDITKERSRDTK